MKKIIALVLALVTVLALCAACGSGSVTPPAAKNAAIVAYVERNKATLLESMESSFAGSSGMTCTSDIKVEGMGIVVSVNINELDNVDDATKAVLQQTYDSMSGSFDSALATMQKELPDLEYFQVRVCEKDGDFLASIMAGNK